MRSTLLPLCLVASISLTACVTIDDVHLADGTLGHRITCNWRDLSIDSCFEKAAEVCGADGFETVTKEGLSTGRAISKGSTDPNSGAFSTRNILIRCNDQRPLPRY